MIAQRAQKRLIDRSADKPLRAGIISQHEFQRIRLSLDPEAVAQLHVVRDGKRRRFAGVDNDCIVVRLRNGTDPFAELADEEIVP